MRCKLPAYSILTLTILIFLLTAMAFKKPVPVEPTPTIRSTTQHVTDETVKDISMTNAEIDLIALVTMAEAEGESSHGKRLVIDVILNRVDSPYFPETVEGVIYQRNQFESVWNGRIDRCYVNEHIRDLVLEEIEERVNDEIVFFRTGHYSIYGEPAFRYENHYFSTYGKENIQ